MVPNSNFCQARSVGIEPQTLHLPGKRAYYYTTGALHLMRQSAVLSRINEKKAI